MLSCFSVAFSAAKCVSAFRQLVNKKRASQLLVTSGCDATGFEQPRTDNVHSGGHVFFVLAVLDEVVDDSGIRQRRGIAEAARLVLGDLAQDPAHDLAGACLRQTRSELNL